MTQYKNNLRGNQKRDKHNKNKWNKYKIWNQIIYLAKKQINFKNN